MQSHAPEDRDRGAVGCLRSVALGKHGCPRDQALRGCVAGGVAGAGKRCMRHRIRDSDPGSPTYLLFTLGQFLHSGCLSFPSINDRAGSSGL